MGFVLSEGAGVVILEELQHALKRGAEPLAELLNCTATAAHFTNPDPQATQATQAARAITRVLQKARLKPEQVGYINAHATSIPLGDVFEVRAVKRALGEAADPDQVHQIRHRPHAGRGGGGRAHLVCAGVA